MSASKQFRLINYNLDGLYLADAVVVVLLATFGICLTNGVIHTGHPHGGLAASLGVLAMIVPVAWRRKAPLAAAIVVGVAGPLNGIVLGSMVRCGACLPAVFLIGYSIGAQRSRSRMAPALVFCAGNVVAQAFYDPQLGPIVTALMLPVLTGFFLLGLVARSRAMTAETLQIRSAQLRNQREATARLSAMADRSRIGAELDGLLRQRLGRIEEAAAAGSMALASAGPEAVASALSTIETEGRAVLRLMREIVGTLHDVSPNQPQPGLADLAALVESATTADARLTVDGGAYRLPAGVELSGYRIVEHFIEAFADAPEASVDVRVCFAPDAVELHMTGPLAADAELASILAAARERSALHSGTLDGWTEGDVCHAKARLPLVGTHA